MLISPVVSNQLRLTLVSLMRQQSRGSHRSVVKIDNDKFQLSINVAHFTKDEIRVKAVTEYVQIEGKQERKTRNGYVVRQFIRKFKLPDGCDPSKMTSTLNSDGVLTIKAVRKYCDSNYPCETVIPVTMADKKEDSSLMLDVKPPEDKCDAMIGTDKDKQLKNDPTPKK